MRHAAYLFCRLPILSLFFFALFATLHAQERADSSTAAATDTALARQLLKKSFVLSDSSWRQAEQAEQIYLRVLGKNSLEYTECLRSKSQHFNAWGKFEEGIALVEKMIDIRMGLLGDNHLEVAKAFILMGNLYRRRGEFDQAMACFQKSLAIRTKLYGGQHLATAPDLVNIGLTLSQKGEFDQAINHYHRALAVMAPPGDPLVKSLMGSCLNGLGLCYKNKEEYEKALVFLQRGLAYAQKVYGENAYEPTIYHSNLMIVYKRLGQFDLAVAHGHKALNFHRRNTRGYAAGNINLNLSDTYRCKKDFENALAHARNALEIALETRGEKSDDTAYACHSLGNIRQDMGQFDSSLVWYRRGLNALGYASEGDFAKIQDLRLLQDLLFSYNLSTLLWYRRDGGAERLQAAIAAAREAVALVNYRRAQLRYQPVSNLVADAAHPVYEAAIATALIQGKQEASTAPIEAAFAFSEQAKGLALQQGMRQTGALAYAGIPDGLLAEERQLKADLADLEKKREAQLGKGLPETDSTVLQLSARVLDKTQAHDALLRRFERDYPRYYRLKYERRDLSVAQIQQQLLQPGQCLLEYFVGDSSVFLFALQTGRFEVFEIKKDFPLEDWVRRLRLTLTDRRLDGAEEYADLAQRLYEKLLRPAQSMLAEDLIIVPDGVLCYLPFEALLTAKPEKAIRFKDHPYLLRRHRVHYGYSASLLQEMRDKQHLRPPTESLAAFAPYFDGDTALLAKIFALDETMRKDLQPLKSSGVEATAAAKLLRGTAFFGKDATEARFAEVAGRYRILHLATHGKANDQKGDYAFLAFSEIKDSVENELLFAREIYNLQLNADLVVLSACETGIGKLHRGEGVSSLARAFAYAGAKGIVTSLWAVNDAKTKDLMVFFYKNLKKGMNKAEALRQAKLSFLEKSSAEEAHPYFWAGFVGIGEMR